MLRFILFFLLAIPLIELWLLIVVGGVIGGLTCVLLVIATAIVGGLLARRQGFDVFLRMRQRQAAGEPIVAEMVDGLVLLFAGLLLLLPGLLTDGLGFLFLIPRFRSYLHGGVVRSFQHASARQNKEFHYTFSQQENSQSSSQANIKKVIDVDTTKT